MAIVGMKPKKIVVVGGSSVKVFCFAFDPTSGLYIFSVIIVTNHSQCSHEM